MSIYTDTLSTCLCMYLFINQLHSTALYGFHFSNVDIICLYVECPSSLIIHFSTSHNPSFAAWEISEGVFCYICK